MVASRPLPTERAPTRAATAEAPATDPGEPAQPAIVLVALVVAVVAPLLIMGVGAARQPWVPTSDEAFTFIRALDVPGHLPLTGAYSRFGFDHPGPPLFYVLAGPSHLFGPSGMFLAVAVVNAAAAAGACLVAWRRGGVVLTTITAAVVLLMIHALGDAAVSPWNPWVAVLPCFTAALLAWGVSQRDWVLLPWLALTASYATQAHVGYAPLAATLVAGATGWVAVVWFRARGDGDGNRPGARVLVVTGVVVAVAWLAPLAQQVTSDDGNLGRLFRHFVSGSEADPDAGPVPDAVLAPPTGDEVLGVIAREFGIPPAWAGADEPVEPFTGTMVPASPATVIPVVVGFAVVVALAWRRRLHDVLALQALAAVLAVVAAASVARVTGGLAPYLVRHTWVASALLALSSAWALARLVGAPAAAPGRTVATVRGPLARGTAVAVAATGLASVVVTVALVQLPLPDAEASDKVLRVIEPTVAALPDGKEVQVRGVGEGAFGTVLGIESELVRRGVPIAADPEVASRYHPAHHGRDPHPATVTVVAGADAASFDAGPNQRLVTAFDPLTPDERRDQDAIQAKVVAAFEALRAGQPVTVTITEEEKARFAARRAQGSGVRIYVDPGA